MSITHLPHPAQTRSRLAAVVLVTLLSLVYVSAAQFTAGADEVTPANSSPTVSSPALSTTIQPDAGASDNEYSYTVTVGDADTLNDLASVTLCLFHSADGDPTCASPDPATDVQLVWTQSTDAFTVDDGAGTLWANGTTATPTSPTLTDTSGIFTFTFVVSEATREGTWTATVTAADGTTTATDSTATAAVNHYAAITTRAQQSFGTLAADTAATVTDSPTVTSNGTTAYSMTSGDFTDGTYSFTLKDAGTPSTDIDRAAGEISYDCNQGATFTDASATRVGSIPTQIGATITASGTVEGGATVSNTCRLLHGGGKPISTYSFTVVNAVSNG